MSDAAVEVILNSLRRKRNQYLECCSVSSLTPLRAVPLHNISAFHVDYSVALFMSARDVQTLLFYFNFYHKSPTCVRIRDADMIPTTTHCCMLTISKTLIVARARTELTT